MSREGSILVRRFEDVRAKDRLPYVGAKRNGFGMVLGHVAVPADTDLETLLTTYFAQALDQAGYKTTLLLEQGASVPAGLQVDAILEGEIQEFWLDLYMATWHNVKVGIRLLDSPSEEVVWQSTAEGSETNVLWIGVSAEFEKVIRQALDKALAMAIADFESDEFARRVAQ